MFHADLQALPDFHHDTGLQPQNSPVQLQLTIDASGAASIDADAIATGSSEAPVLTAVAESGSVELAGGFSFAGRLVVNVSGLDPYDGPVPGLTDIKIPFADAVTFDPYLLSSSATAKAEIAPTDLPPIPLPGGLPGTLQLKIQEGSSVNLEFRGVCAAIQEDVAHYTGRVTRSGTLVLLPTVVLEVPIIGSKSFELPSVSVPIPGLPEDVDLGQPNVIFSGATAGEGERAKVGTCDESGSGGSAGSGGAAGSAGSAGSGGLAGAGGSSGSGGKAGAGGSGGKPADAGTDAADEDAEAGACATVGMPCDSSDECCEGFFCAYDGSEMICKAE